MQKSIFSKKLPPATIHEEDFRPLIQQVVSENAELMQSLEELTKTEHERKQNHATEKQQLVEQLNKARSQLQLVTEERDHYASRGGSGSSSSSSSSNHSDPNRNKNNMSNNSSPSREHQLAEALEELRNQHEDTQCQLQNSQDQVKSLQNQIASLKKEVAAAKASAAAAEKSNSEIKKKNESAANSSGNSAVIDLQRRISELETTNQEIMQQRDIFIDREEKMIAKESREVAELQAWNQLLKKLVTSLKSVRSQWDSDVERGDEQAVTRFITENIDAESSRFIVESLSRVSGAMKKGPTAIIMSSSSSSSSSSASASASASSYGQQQQQHHRNTHHQPHEAENFNLNFRPAALDVLRLLHGVVSDCAVLWAQVISYKQKAAAAKSAAEAAAAQNTGSSLAFWKR